MSSWGPWVCISNLKTKSHRKNEENPYFTHFYPKLQGTWWFSWCFSWSCFLRKREHPLSLRPSPRRGETFEGLAQAASAFGRSAEGRRRQRGEKQRKVNRRFCEVLKVIIIITILFCSFWPYSKGVFWGLLDYLILFISFKQILGVQSEQDCCTETWFIKEIETKS